MYWERFGYMLCYINSTIKCVSNTLTLTSRYSSLLVRCSTPFVTVHFDERLRAYFVASVIDVTPQHTCRSCIDFTRSKIRRPRAPEPLSSSTVAFDVRICYLFFSSLLFVYIRSRWVEGHRFVFVLFHGHLLTFVRKRSQTIEYESTSATARYPGLAEYPAVPERKKRCITARPRSLLVRHRSILST